VLTAQWEKTLTRYDDFGLELALMEAGHIGQNLVLAAAASDIGISSLADFKDEPLMELLDLDPFAEQIVYTFTLGVPQS
jgi:SagB-type dehydrogenase family enzyme